MRKILSLVASLTLLAAGSLHAQESLSVQATGATGAPGDQVFVSLTYDYGTGTEVIAENLNFTYDSSILSFLFPESTVVSGGVSQSLGAYVADLKLVADAGDGFTLFNLAPNTLAPGEGGFQLGFTQPDFFGFPGHVRTGQVVFNAAFDIAATARNGNSVVSFAGSTQTDLATFSELEYPAALQNVQITVQAAVVPEPEMALMLLPGLALIGLHVRRRRARLNQTA